MNDIDPNQETLSDQPKVLEAYAGYGEAHQAGAAADRKRMRWALAVAAVFHLVLLTLTLPSSEADPTPPQGERSVYVVQRVQLKPPQVRQERATPKPKAKRIPIPDPTPDEPEPIREVEEIALELDLESVDLVLGADFGIPESGPAPSGESPLYVGGDVLAPVAVHQPQPQYTEEARLARIQGVVILQAVVDKEGRVSDVRILKGLPMGLDEQALQTVSTWTYRPATRDGLPVPVYITVTIGFSLQ